MGPNSVWYCVPQGTQYHAESSPDFQLFSYIFTTIFINNILLYDTANPCLKLSNWLNMDEIGVPSMKTPMKCWWLAEYIKPLNVDRVYKN